MPVFSPRHRFSDWPNGDIPAVAAGVYATPTYSTGALTASVPCRLLSKVQFARGRQATLRLAEEQAALRRRE